MPQKETPTHNKISIKKYLPRSLFGRTIMIIITPLILLQLTATITFFDRHWVKMTERLSDAVAGELATISSIIEENNADQQIILNLSQKIARHQEIYINFEENKKLENIKNQYDSFGIYTSLSESIKRKVNRPFNIKLDFTSKRIDIWIKLEQGVLHAYMPERRLYSSSGYIFILWLIGLSLLFFAISVWLMRNQIRPIHRLASAANRLGKGQDVSFFKPTGASEVRQAAISFLKMRDRIQRQIEQRTAMLAGVSHDLRTPITRLKLQLEMMSDLPPNAKDISEMQNDLAEMEQMIEAYLSFAKGLDYEDTQCINLQDFIKNLAQRFEKKDKKIHVDNMIPNISISMRPQQMTRALNNIIGNALKFGSELTISIKYPEPSTTNNPHDKGKNVLITFEDNGPGIAEDEYDKVFRPFYRIESSRNKKTGGVGLGLNIAQDIVLGHGGQIELSKPEGTQGLIVTISLPE